MHPDHLPYARFTTRARLEKSINSLLGIIEGIAIDRNINSAEISFLERWLEDHNDVKERHPYSELIPVVQAAVVDGVLTKEEHDDIIWLCNRLCSSEQIDRVTSELQRLHSILGGIASDGKITETEIIGLVAWLGEHEHLKTCWPYDEIDSLVMGIMKDNRIDDHEHAMILQYFSEFVSIGNERTIANPVIKVGETVAGLCVVCPEITFEKSTFCFTGASARYTRDSLSMIVENLGGKVVSAMSKSVNYLIIGADGNPCWAYACYGRKVEKAVALRKNGCKILIVHENDFHDAVADES